MNPPPDISPSESLVGAVALELVLLRLKPLLEEDLDFRGAFHVLSGFTAEQLVGFIRAKEAAGVRAARLQIQFPEFAVYGYGIDPSHTAAESAVNVRNRERNGAVVITAEVETDAEASLADSDRTDVSDLKDKSAARVWVDLVSKNTGINLLPEDRRKVEAMLKGLFDTGRCPTSKAGEFLHAVLTSFQNEPLHRAAGKSLPVIGLPLFEDCFSSLNETKMAQPSQWATKFKSHYALECYLDKREPTTQQFLEADKLRECLAKLRSEEQQPPIPDDILEAFHDYIESEGARNTATKRLLFDFDWNYTRHCFDKTNRTSSKDFSERTRSALIAEGIAFTQDDELVIRAISKIARKSGSASDEFREFFGRRAEALEQDPGLFLEWEDFVHGKKIVCVDLFQGIFECLQRSIRGFSLYEPAYIVLEGRRQKKPNHFMEMNQRACEFFERAYGSLEVRTKRKIRFKDSLVVHYGQQVLPVIKDLPKFKGGKKTGEATTFEFLVSVFQIHRDGTERKISTLSLKWKFPVSSVLAQETADFDAICRYHAQRKTTLVACLGEYEVVGPKGTPLSLSLENVEGFADVARGGGRGAFVPAQDRIESLAAAWKKTLDDATSRGWLREKSISELKISFGAFESAYTDAILTLRKDALANEKTAEVASAYRLLLLKINGLPQQDARRQLLRIVLRIGLAQIRRAGRRSPLAVVCPWHPLRMEATAARQRQVLSLIERLLGENRPPFSDGASGSLFFREVEQLLNHPLYPEMTVIWENSQAFPRVVTQTFGSYTLHQPAEASDELDRLALDEESTASAAIIEQEVIEYLRLQPHERDNFSVLLYNCDSPDLPTAVVKSINRINSQRDEDKITCQVMLMHSDEDHLRQIYRDLVARGVDTETDPTEANGDFLAKVRVNIAAANRLRREGRSQPVDIAYCRDLISKKANPNWDWIKRETVPPSELQPHQWSRRLPVSEGDRQVRLQLVCPAQTEAGWAYLYSLAALCANGADDAWEVGKCPVLMRCLDFDDQRVDRIFRETHELATWVVNQDELLDRKLLEARHVKVIRYVQSATHGRNLIISSAARETLLVNTLKEKLTVLLPSDQPTEVIEHLCQKFMEDANKISGGLVLKAARRANNTNEILGMVLSRYIVQSELRAGRPIAWCFLDDYSQWLGKREGANIADLLVLAPKQNEDGSMHLDAVVTEAKFVTYDGLAGAASTSSKQLIDTLAQLTEALDGETQTIDQDIWLARLSDLLVSQLSVPPGGLFLDTAAWRRAIRRRECSVKIWGYSHVFVHEPQDLTAQVSTVKGLNPTRGRSNLDCLQEIFGPGHLRELLLHFHDANFNATRNLRQRNGHTHLGGFTLYHLAGKPKSRPEEDVQDALAEAPEDPPSGLPDPSSPAIEQQPYSAEAGDQNVGAGMHRSTEPASVTAWSHTESASLSQFLELRAAMFQTSEDEGRTWLETITTRLRQALVTRGLPAKLAEGIAPILTPNAGIIKLQGSKDLTVQAVESRADEIFTSEGIKILGAMPEAGRVSIAVERPHRQVLHTEPVLLDYLKSYNQETQGEKLCIGIREEDGRPMFLDPFNQPHTLIAGITGSGKSVLVQNLILSIAATRSPEEAHIYLIDPKFGVDYRPLDELPHVEAGSGGIIDDPSAAIKVLDGLVDEMNRRYELFKQTRVPNIHAYRRTTGKPLPSLWIIHDEFADWMQTEDYKQAVPEIVGRLSVKARAAGIFLIFAAQRPDKDVMPMQLRSQLGNRLILKVDNAGTAEIAMGIKHSGAERLLGRGHMLARTGDAPDPVFVQVPFIDIEHTVPTIVRLIRLQHGRPVESGS
jgi:S-DNA-T family DNA segregation ATPase FtsK/SpoIIIE